MRLAWLLPFMAAASQGEECHSRSHHVHRVQTVLHQVLVVLTLEKTLGEESRHSYRGNLNAQRVGRVPEQLLELWVAQFVVKQDTLSQRSHIHFHSIGLDILGGFVANGQMSPECVNWTQADDYNQFCAGKAALAEIGTWHLATIADDVNGAFEYKVVLLPTGDEGTSSSTIGGENFGICTGCKDVEEAANFLKWFMSAEEEANWAVQAGKLPIRSDAEPVYDYEEEGFETFLDEMNYALARGPHAEWPTISEQIYTAAQKVFLNGESAADALAAANEVIAPILEVNPLPEQ